MCCLYPVEQRQRNLHDDHIGQQSADLFQHRLPVGGLPHNLGFFQLFQDSAQAVANNALIVS
ncbi:MAG: hypothetical protein IH624_19170 [Phycisphaerae bacterium]|nr:hypothetical protein [Phycisphaerae bacterium]